MPGFEGSDVKKVFEGASGKAILLPGRILDLHSDIWSQFPQLIRIGSEFGSLISDQLVQVIGKKLCIQFRYKVRIYLDFFLCNRDLVHRKPFQYRTVFYTFRQFWQLMITTPDPPLPVNKP